MTSRNEETAGDCSDLSFKLEQASSSIPTLRVTLYNASSSISYTVLTWGTPLDDLAFTIAKVYEVTDKETGEKVSGPGIMISRIQPPPKDAFVQVPAQGEITKDFTFEKVQWLPKKFKLVAPGNLWKGVWTKSIEQVTGPDGLDGSLRGEYKSVETEINRS